MLTVNITLGFMWLTLKLNYRVLHVQPSITPSLFLQDGSFRRQSLSGGDEFPYSQCRKLYRYRNVRCTVTDQTRKKTRNF